MYRVYHSELQHKYKTIKAKGAAGCKFQFRACHAPFFCGYSVIENVRFLLLLLFLLSAWLAELQLAL